MIIRFNKPEVGNRLSADEIAGLRAIEKQMSDTRSEATKDEIAACVYFIWEQEGKPVGRALDHWLQAELQLAASLWHESYGMRRADHRPLRTDHASTTPPSKGADQFIEP